MRRETAALLERLDHGDIAPDALVRALRPAAQQVVSIARALSHDVRLLIMDEPSAILDDHEIDTLFDVVRRLTAEGVGVVYISHRLDEIERIGDRVTVLSDGRDGGDRPARRHAARRARASRWSAARSSSCIPDRARRRSGRRRCSRCAASRGSPRVQATCSFEVRAGEILGIGGLVGAGRTELLRLIYGARAPDDGEVVQLDGKRLPGGRPDAAIAAGIGLAPEDRKSQGLLLGSGRWPGT